jgi:hypothetical protein
MTSKRVYKNILEFCSRERTGTTKELQEALEHLNKNINLLNGEKQRSEAQRAAIQKCLTKASALEATEEVLTENGWKQLKEEIAKQQLQSKTHPEYSNFPIVQEYMQLKDEEWSILKTFLRDNSFRKGDSPLIANTYYFKLNVPCKGVNEMSDKIRLLKKSIPDLATTTLLRGNKYSFMIFMHRDIPLPRRIHLPYECHEQVQKLEAAKARGEPLTAALWEVKEEDKPWKKQRRK